MVIVSEAFEKEKTKKHRYREPIIFLLCCFLKLFYAYFSNSNSFESFVSKGKSGRKKTTLTPTTIEFPSQVFVKKVFWINFIKIDKT